MPQFRRGFWRNHHAAAIGQLGKQGCIRAFEGELDLIVARCLNALHGRQFALAAGFRQCLRALDIGDDGRGIERRLVVENHVLAQVHGQFGTVIGPFPVRRQLRHDLECRADIDQLVAQSRIDDAADEGARLCRVEDIGIVLETDTQFAGTSRHSNENTG